MQPVKQRNYRVGETDVDVAFYNGAYEINFITQSDGAYTSIVLHAPPHQFKRLVNQWLELIKDIARDKELENG